MNRLFLPRTQFVLALSLLFFVASCTETPKSFTKKNQTALNATLDHLASLGAKAFDQASGAEGPALPAGAPVISLDDIGNYSYGGDANAQLFTVQDLQDPDAQSPAMHLFPSRQLWRDVHAMVKDGRFPEQKPAALKSLKDFSNWRYVVVIRARSVGAPQIQQQPISTSVTDNRTFSSGTFVSGFIEADALLYDLSDLSFLGSFPFTAQNSQNVETTTYGAAAGVDALQGRLDKDFTDQIKRAIVHGLVDRLPADRIYLNGNLRQSLMDGKDAK